MPLPFDIINTYENTRRANRRQAQQDVAELSAVLGNENNIWYVPGKNGNEVYVRLLGNTENGNATYQPSTTAFVRGNFFEYAGSPVLVKYNRNGDLVLIGPDETQVAEAGGALSLSSLNSGSKQRGFLNLDNVLRAISRTVSRGSTDSTLVSVAQFIYDHYGAYNLFGGTPLVADKIDLAPYIPAVDLQLIAQLWLDTFDGTIHVTTSTAQSIATDLVLADYQETWLGSNRFQDWLPLQSYVLKDNATTLTQKDLGRDHRQQFHLPNELGNEYDLVVNTRIRNNRQWLIKDNLTIQAGYSLVIEAGGQVIIDHTAAHVKIEGDTMTGQLLFSGNGRVLKEIQIKAEGLKLGATAPTQAVIGAFSVLQFAGAGTTDTVYTSFHIPTDWSTGTDLNIHIHWSPVNANAGAVKWQLTWNAVASETNELISGAGTTTSVIDSTQTLQDELLETNEMTIAGASLAQEDTIGLKIFRDPTDGSDTYTSAASLVIIEIEYTADKLGTAI